MGNYNNDVFWSQLLLPLALWEPFGTSWNHVAVVPATTLVAIFFFGIEELAVQLEEPFSILPLLKWSRGGCWFCLEKQGNVFSYAAKMYGRLNSY